jgi:hypothetical protein
VFFLLVFLVGVPAHIAVAQNAILLIAHGSYDPQWNQKLLEVQSEVEDVLSERGDTLFDTVCMSFLEFAEPSVHTVITEFESQGIDNIIGIPLFVAPSGHSVFDIPAVMGMYSDPVIGKTLAEEGTAIANTHTRITFGPTLHLSEAINEIMLDRVRQISTCPDSESVVIICHGSSDFMPFWSDLCRRIGAYICGKTGITYFDYVFAGMGQAFFSQSYGTIADAAEHRPHVLIVGLYMAHGVDEIASFALAGMKGAPLNPGEVFEGTRVTFSTHGVLPDRRVAEWVVKTAYDMFKQHRDR